VRAGISRKGRGVGKRGYEGGYGAIKCVHTKVNAKMIPIELLQESVGKEIKENG
jgi:hypothetical protein